MVRQCDYCSKAKFDVQWGEYKCSEKSKLIHDISEAVNCNSFVSGEPGVTNDEYKKEEPKLSRDYRSGYANGVNVGKQEGYKAGKEDGYNQLLPAYEKLQAQNKKFLSDTETLNTILDSTLAKQNTYIGGNN